MPKRLAVYAPRARDYQAISRALRKVGMCFDLLDPSKPIPRWIGVVLTTRDGRRELKDLSGVEVAEVSVEDPDPLIVSKAVLALQGKSMFGELLIGVDPGHSYGVAIIADSTLIGFNIYHRAEEVLEAVHELVAQPIFKRAMVRIGAGSPSHRDKVLSLFKERLKEVVVEVVDEAEASSLVLSDLVKDLPKDAASAVQIALKKGTRV